MEMDLTELKEEIRLLNERIDVLEKNENKRKAYFYLKILIRVIIILACVYGVWKGYEYISKELPSILEEKIKEMEPTKKYY